MKLVTCRSGHFYDEDKYRACPFCGETAAEDPEDTAFHTPWETGPASLIPEKYTALGDISFCRKGGHGTVYTITPRPVPRHALKVLECNGNEAKEGAALKEAEIMQLLGGCDHIIQIEDCGVYNGRICILEEYCEPFPDYRRREILTYGDVLVLAEHITLALMECQSKGVYHLDIKPGNIFVGTDHIYKLGDFSASELSRPVTDGSLKGRPLRGTMEYIAPEVFIGRNYSEKSEMYSLGLVLYGLLNNMQLPFMPECGKEEANSQRLSGTALPEPKNGPQGLKDIVMKACAYKAEDRFGSYEELLKLIRDIRDSIPEEMAEKILPGEIPVRWWDDGPTIPPFGSPDPGPDNADRTAARWDMESDADRFGTSAALFPQDMESDTDSNAASLSLFPQDPEFNM